MLVFFRFLLQCVCLFLHSHAKDFYLGLHVTRCWTLQTFARSASDTDTFVPVQLEELRAKHEALQKELEESHEEKVKGLKQHYEESFEGD